MKIVHISISAPFVDSWGYQDNLLPKYLQQKGVDNYLIVSSNDLPSSLKPEEIEEIKSKGSRYSLNGFIVIRIRTKKISTSSAITIGLRKALEEIRPDVIFHHNINCTSMPISARYAKKHSIPMVCDNHVDPINVTTNKLWLWFYYKFLTQLSCKLHNKQIYKAYGVTHSRCEFIRDYFGIPQEKIDFLPIGADVDLAATIDPKDALRKKYGFNEQDFVIVSGGKMGAGKRTEQLIRAVDEIQTSIPNIKLVLFGRFDDVETAELADSSKSVTVQGWCDRTKTLELLKMADVACWPYHHTTLIEDAVSVSTPLICRKTGTTEHLICGNGLWIEHGTSDEIVSAIKLLYKLYVQQPNQLEEECALMKERLSYKAVAEKLLSDIAHFNH